MAEWIGAVNGAPGNRRRTRRIGVSPRSHALDFAAYGADGIELRAVHALRWPYGVSASVTDAQAGHLSDDRIDEIHPRPDWLIQFAKGDAGPVLVRQSRHAALLVIGSPDHVGLGRLIAGSIAHFCVSHATCPVVVVPTPLPPSGQ